MNRAEILQLNDNPLEPLVMATMKEIECIESMRLSVATTSTATLMWTTAQRDYSLLIILFFGSMFKNTKNFL